MPLNKTISDSTISAEWGALSLQVELLEDASEQLSLMLEKSVDLATAVELFWAIVLRVYSASDHIVFERVNEPAGNSGCAVLDFDKDSACTSIAELINSRKTTTSAQHSYNTTVWVTEGLDSQDPNKRSPSCVDSSVILLQLHRNATTAQAQGTLWHWHPCVSPGHAMNILHSLHQVARCILERPTSSVEDLNLFSPENQMDLQRWNHRHPSPEFLPLPGMLHGQARERPDAPAVCAWDGEWTYRELEHHAHLLTSHLTALGVQQGDMVLLRAEKSKWAVAGMMAILMTGAVCVPIDIREPVERLKQVIEVTQAKFIFTTAAMKDSDFKPNAVLHQVLLPPLEHARRQTSASQLPTISPDQVGFVFFTSGSTGVPKGVVQEHYALSLTVQEIARATHKDLDTRTFQYASFGFDVSVGDIFGTFYTGGCICIPSEDQRLNDLSGTMNRMRCTHICVTATTLATLSPNEVPCLRQLTVGGESLTCEQLRQWAPHVCLSTIYGTTESVIWDTYRDRLTAQDSPSNIGKAIGPSTWIVDEASASKLMPIGAVGELLIGGPLLARGYLNDSLRTAASFITSPAWLHPFRGNGIERLYRTGDLAQYNPDGTIEFLGRKDQQIKINGQRVELGDIEYALRQSLPKNTICAVDVIHPKYRGRQSTLAAFLCGPDDIIRKVSLTTLQGQLRRLLPAYMIPSVLIPLADGLPTTPSGKTDRARLRQLGATLSSAQILGDDQPHTVRRVPATATETTLQILWTKVLGMEDPSLLSMDDNFFEIGGSSVHAIHLVALAREHGFHFTVKDVFEQRRLSCLAAVAKSRLPECGSQSLSSVAPFSLLDTDLPVEIVRERVAAMCGVHQEEIEDVFPCTPLQEGLLALTAKQPGDYIAQVVVGLPPIIDLDRFRAAYVKVAAQNPILRTRFVSLAISGTRIHQVVVDQDPEWGFASDLELCKATNRQQLTCQLGEPVIRCTLVRNNRDSKRYFLWAIHHALFDGWSLPLILDAIERQYLGQGTVELLPFQHFIQYVKTDVDQAACRSFWQSELDGAERFRFPPDLPSSYQSNSSSQFIRHTVDKIQWPSTGITRSTLARAAWALLLSRFSSAKDIVFGATVIGRQAPVPGIGRIAGPTIATVPLRVQLDGLQQQPLSEFLERLQRQALAIVPFEQLGLPEISRLSAHAEQACKFQTLLVVQLPDSASEGSHLLDRGDDSAWDVLNTYAVTLQTWLYDSEIRFQLHFDEKVLSLDQAERLLHRLELIFRQLCTTTPGDLLLSEIGFCTARDMRDLETWNAIVPSPACESVLQAIARRAQQQPDAPAIKAWDGTLSYRDLYAYMTRLASKLVSEYGLKRGQRVLLCSEKSLWCVVGFLSVLKAQGVCTLIDSSTPSQRIQMIMRTSQTVLALTSELQLCRFKGQIDTILLEKGLFMNPVSQSEGRDLDECELMDEACVVFTSGSTGIPKAIQWTHLVLATTALEMGIQMCLSTESQVFQMSSYAFDVSIHEILATLVNGGCLCVPSEKGRIDELAQTITASQANFLIITPSTGQVLDPAILLCLRQVVFAGEPLEYDLAMKWARWMKVFNWYGPAECSLATCCRDINESWQAKSIGTGLSTVTWVVDPQDHGCLLPIGAVGELLLEGPCLASGYINDDVRSATSFIGAPAWWYRFRRASVEGRLYKTGDLVRYTGNGSLVYIGRKDTQVKIRGQRVELEEIEHQVRHVLGSDQMIICEVIMLERDSRSIVCVFISAASQDEDIRCLPEADAGEIKNRLEDILPSYMVPSAFVALKTFPNTATGKVDRQSLRCLASALLSANRNKMSAKIASKRPPFTVLEQALQQLWVDVLGLPQVNIGLDDHFIRLGGNSIDAMRLVALARSKGFSLSVKDVLTHPRFSDQVQKMYRYEDADECSFAPFSLLGNYNDVSTVHGKAAVRCRVQPELIEDIFPCTPMQTALLALTSKRAGDYVSRDVYHIIGNRNNFQQAWQMVAAATPILRTRIVDLAGPELYQAVVHDTIEWEHVNGSLEEYLKYDQLRQMGLGTRLARWAVVRDPSSIDKFSFVWTIHHALYDGWSLRLILDQVERAYKNQTLMRTTPFQHFTRYIDVQAASASAESSWREQLSGAVAPAFPVFPSTQYQPLAKAQTKRHFISAALQDQTGVTLSTVIRAAWSVLLAHYTGTDDVVFGAIVLGRQVPIPGIEAIVGPTIAMVPIRARLQEQDTVQNVLQSLQRQSVDMIPFEQFGLHRIRRLSEETERACRFESVIVIQPAEEDQDPSLAKECSLFEHRIADRAFGVFNSNALLLRCGLQRDGVTFHLHFDDSLVDHLQADRILCQFENLVVQMCHSSPELRLVDLELVSPSDLQEIWKWNQIVPSSINSTIGIFFQEMVRQFPLMPAIHAWDAQLTYMDLNQYSSRLAHQLVSQGLKRKDIIPVCFEKSAWTVVAILGVIKAGGTVVMLDPHQPENRQQSIVAQLDASMIISSRKQHSLAQRLRPGYTVITVDKGIRDAEQQEEAQRPQLPESDPSDSLYIVFTSGSTGTPKGVVITHTNFCSLIHSRKSLLSYGVTARVLDIVSYAFDVSWTNILCTLCTGACLCIPADTKDVAATIKQFQPTIMGTTPSIARLLDPNQFPSLKTLIIGGEPASLSDLIPWKEKVQVFNSYGPAECTVSVSLTHLNTANSIHIGRGVGASMWIVDCVNSNRLASIGAIGELWLEGPQVGRGYLNDPEKTAAAFIEGPLWLQEKPQGYGRRGRLYRTGDLVQYNSDGTLRLLGRRDAQTKLHGQRVELEEVEYHVRRCLPSGFDVVAEVITSQSNSSQLLVAFVCDVAHKAVDENDSRGLDLRHLKQTVGPKISETLPSYMCPSGYVSLPELPRVPSGKIDRRKLQAIGSTASISELTDQGPNASLSSKRAPLTANETKLQQLWAATLGIAPDCIGADDSFLQIDGGDSISAMRLVSHARESGISFTVAEVFMHPKLCDLAQVVVSNICKEDPVPPFSLCQGSWSADCLREEAAARCNVAIDQIQDVFPCTPLQQGLLALTAKSPDHYTATEVFVLDDKLDLDRLHIAWKIVVADTAILRTRIVDLTHIGLCQVVVEAPISWKTCDSLSSAIGSQRSGVGLGTTLTRWALVVETNGQRSLVWTIHHALYDGWSMPLILQQVERAYYQQKLQPFQSLQPFIRFLSTVDKASSREFWSSQLRECDASSFPLLPSTSYEPRATGKVDITLPTIEWPRCLDVAPSVWIRAAWAIFLGRFDGVTEVTFGASVSGRQVPVTGVELIIGPTIATVPVRIILDWSQSIGEFVQYLHHQGTEMVPFEHIGLHNLKRINGDTKRACQFQSLLNIQHFQSTPSSRLWTRQADAVQGRFDSYAWILDVELHRTNIILRAEFDEVTVPRRQAQRIIHQLGTILSQFSRNAFAASTPLGHFDFISLSDLKDIWEWNAVVPKEISICLQDIITRHISRRPDALAVEAWDGQLTYKQLDLYSTRLASHLHHNLGVKSGTMVPLCFEKSMWTVVALFAVMKAGGAFTLMEASYPKKRMQTIVQQINKRLILSSSACQTLAAQLAEQAVVVSCSTICQLPAPQFLKGGRPQDRLYVVFTSGSTGTPKGAVITHANFCSAIKHQANTLGYSQSTRVFDFASYNFDIAVSNVLHCLAAGGCLCIPSEAERKHDLPGAMERMRVNLIDLTPSVARTINPTSVPSLKTLVLGGETATRADIVRWAPYVHVLNGIGQAECTVTTTMATMDPAVSGTPGIGRGLGANTWIVDPEDYHRLTAIGAIGELLVEGPLFGEGYLNDEDKTSVSFIRDPHWLVKGPPDDHSLGRSGRLYKTGDLVRYDIDGSLLFVGRKDAQTKIRGQRIELEEVEYHVWRLLQGRALVSNLAAEVTVPRGASSSILIVFICPIKEKDNSTEVYVMDFRSLPEEFRQLNVQLAKELPPALIPFAYVPINRIPLAPTGKTDRKKLKLLGTGFTTDELANFGLNPREPRRPPSTAMERHLQHLWAEIFAVSADDIAANDDFLQLGGDSIFAMRLTGLGRKCGMNFTAMDVLSQSRLCDLAKVAQAFTNGKEGMMAEVAPFIMLQTDDITGYLRRKVQPFIEYPTEEVQDVFPVTHFQAECIRGALQRPPLFWNYFFVDLDSQIDIARLRESCRTLTQHLSILRTVFIPHDKSFLQVVLRDEQPGFHEVNNVDDDLPAASETLCRRDWQTAEVKLGRQFSHFILMTGPTQKKVRLIIRMSHAQYDGISLGPMMETLAAAYQGLSLPHSESFASFVEYTITRREPDRKYWQSVLSGSSMTRINILKGSNQSSDLWNHSYTISGNVKLTRRLPKGVTAATALTACWASVVASYSRQNDVVFGRVVAGRAGSTNPNISNVVGPCLNIVPVRARWEEEAAPSWCPGKVIASIQQQQVEAMPMETTRLSDIVDSCTDWPTDTEFGSVFQCQNIDEATRVTLAGNDSSLDTIRLGFCPRQLWLLVKPGSEDVDVQLFGTMATMERKAAQTLFDDFCARVADIDDDGA